MTLQASHAATDFATELAQLISFVCSDIIWVQDRFCTFTQIAFETSKRLAQFSTLEPQLSNDSSKTIQSLTKKFESKIPQWSNKCSELEHMSWADENGMCMWITVAEWDF